jgi:hypothetical protein
MLYFICLFSGFPHEIVFNNGYNIQCGCKVPERFIIFLTIVHKTITIGISIMFIKIHISISYRYFMA